MEDEDLILDIHERKAEWLADMGRDIWDVMTEENGRAYIYDRLEDGVLRKVYLPEEFNI